jgi:hypothetical protein
METLRHPQPRLQLELQFRPMVQQLTAVGDQMLLNTYLVCENDIDDRDSELRRSLHALLNPFEQV